MPRIQHHRIQHHRVVRHRTRVTAVAPLVFIGAAGMFSRAGLATDDVAGQLMQLNNNGAWSWFEDDRAIIDPANGNVLIGSIGNTSGTGGAARNGKVEVATFNLATLQPTITSTFATLTSDDHNTPAFLVRPDGRYLTAYSAHGSDNLTRMRISTNPGDATSWGAETTLNNGIGATYNNLFRLSAEGKTYNFTRTVGYDPNFLVSTNDGTSFSYGGKLLRDTANNDSTRPYVKYTSNGVDKIYFTTTEAHPRDLNTGVYTGYIQNGNMFKTDGTLVGALGSAPVATSFTTLLAPGQNIGGETRTNGWTADMTLDAAGNPVTVFTSRVAGSTADHRLYYAKWNGSAWNVNEIAKMGAPLYAAEQDYTGLAAIEKRSPNTVYISTAIDPSTNAALAHHEIFKGVTADGGDSWAWSAITSNSTVDNVRPIVPDWSTGSAVFWMRGTYSTYTNFNTAIVGLVDKDNDSVGKMTYFDATTTNTKLATGGEINPTTGGASGATDNRWHVRTGMGNGIGVFTADELAGEDAPMIATTVPNVGAGTYDVYAYFWSNPGEDWQFLAGLSSGSLQVFQKDFAEQMTEDEFTGAITLDGTNLAMYRAYLGRVTLASLSGLTVYVDDSTANIISKRTWYDGVGLAAVTIVPEPTAACTILLGTMLLSRRRL